MEWSQFSQTENVETTDELMSKKGDEGLRATVAQLKAGMFTSGEHAAIQSGITSDMVGVLDATNFQPFCVCSTQASTQTKAVTSQKVTELNQGQKITVKFENGNTYGTCVGTSSNQITQANAVKLKLNDFTEYPIKIGGEYAGENFCRAGDVHELIFDGSAWNDVTADVIYKGETQTGTYEKKRNGLITQRMLNLSSGNNYTDYNLILPFTSTNYAIYNSGVNNDNTGAAPQLLYKKLSSSRISIKTSSSGYGWFGDVITEGN